VENVDMKSMQRPPGAIGVYLESRRSPKSRRHCTGGIVAKTIKFDLFVGFWSQKKGYLPLIPKVLHAFVRR
jgi:hypothetical protein